MQFNRATYCIRKIVTSQFTLLIFVLVVWMDANRMCVLCVCYWETEMFYFSVVLHSHHLYAKSHDKVLTISPYWICTPIYRFSSTFRCSNWLRWRLVRQFKWMNMEKLNFPTAFLFRHDSHQVYWTCCSNSKEFNTKAMFSIYISIFTMIWYDWNQQHTKTLLYLSTVACECEC